MMTLLRSSILIIAASLCLLAQMPRGVYSWWARPQIARSLNLSPAQRRQIRATVLEYRPHLMEVRTQVNQAEQDLAAQFDHDPVDTAKANEATERLIAARSDLTRTLTQLSLKLRLVLTEQQWQELQRRRPGRGEDAPPPPPEPPAQR
jgi:Spy/CpxP family protein refolding chaperone